MRKKIIAYTYLNENIVENNNNLSWSLLYIANFYIYHHLDLGGYSAGEKVHCKICFILRAFLVLLAHCSFTEYVVCVCGGVCWARTILLRCQLSSEWGCVLYCRMLAVDTPASAAQLTPAENSPPAHYSAPHNMILSQVLSYRTRPKQIIAHPLNKSYSHK